jgi:hypothetical protein
MREALLRAEPEQSVTEIAMSWCFTHMGRFRSNTGSASAKAPRKVSYVCALPGMSVSDCRNPKILLSNRDGIERGPRLNRHRGACCVPRRASRRSRARAR